MTGKPSPGRGSYRAGEAPGWHMEAACRGTRIDMTANPADYQANQAAKRVCAECVVQPDCLAWALSRDDVGVWGALTQSERQAWRRRQHV